MKKILVLGAGRSASTLINYLLDNSQKEDWQITVADQDEQMAQEKISGHNRAKAFSFDVLDKEERTRFIKEVDIVISMLPVKLHHLVALTCLEENKNLVTASYVSDDMQKLNGEVAGKNLIFLNECGLDPGIDHMSAMKVIDEIRDKGYHLKTFESFTGGLLAPGTDDSNPWEYKFTWNPRNVVLAGQGFVKFIQENKYKYIPYHKVFRRTEQVHIPGYGYFEGYANRDSLKYLDIYNLRELSTIYRGTFRRPGFCRTWDIFVQLGATDDSFEMEGVENMSHRDFINSFLFYNPHDTVELKLAHYMNVDLEGPEMHRLKWLGLFENEPVGIKKGTPAQVLEHILKKKWSLKPEDRDMIVMWHKFEYIANNQEHEIHSSMIAIGDDMKDTAMAKTVGLPVGIAAKLILQNKINERGVVIPIKKDIYTPILNELKTLGIELNEKKVR
ncbi:MAG: saccharopine dehydrogenase C-terminal domain-containing protein [Candidatus Cyclobacteriaceae bacterium M2_1C_046]